MADESKSTIRKYAEAKAYTGDCSLMTAHLLEPDTFKGKTKYKTKLLWPKDKKPVALMKTVDALAKEDFGIGFNKLAYPLVKDGDKYADAHDEKNEGDDEEVGKKEYLRGYYFCDVSTNKKPSLIDHKKDPLSDEAADNLIYNGGRARARLQLATFKGQDGRGVCAFLEVVQLIPGGKRIDGPSSGARLDAAEGFDDVELDEDTFGGDEGEDGDADIFG